MDVKQMEHVLRVPKSNREAVQEHWPARTRRLVDDIRDLAGNWLRAPLQRTLEDAMARLYQMAENELSGARMQDHLRLRDVLLENRHLVESRFLAGVGEAIDRLGAVHPAHAESATKEQPLSLVVPAEQELDSTLQLIVSRGEARGSTTLVELGYRLAVLVATPPLEGPAMPLGPHALTMAFEEAVRPLELVDHAHIALLHSFDRILVTDIHSLCDQVNRYLLSDGILPQLRAYMSRMPGSGTAVDSDTDVDEEPYVDEAFDNFGRALSNRPAETPAPRAPVQDAAQAPAPPSMPLVDRRRHQAIDVLDQLRELLAQRRNPGSVAASAGGVASPEELQTALAALQAHVSQVTEKTRRELRSAQALRRELQEQLNLGRPADAPPVRLSRDDDDVVELVSMLFNELGGQVPKNGQAHSALGGLQLPMLRLAVQDKQFFEQHEHPARKLLNTVVETARDWLDNMEGGPDPIMQGRIEQLIKRANHEPPSSGLYTTLLADIEQSLTELKLRARVAERRQVEAARARDRLDRSRERAAELIRERVAKANPKGLLKVLLERAWTDVLTLTLLRHGEADPACRECLLVTDQLLGLAPVKSRGHLKEDVEAGLYRIGMAEDEAGQVAQRLLAHGGHGPATEGDSPAGHATPSNTELVVRLKQRQRLGDDKPEDAPVKPSVAAEPAPAKLAPVIQAVPEAAAPMVESGPVGPPSAKPAGKPSAGVPAVEAKVTTRGAKVAHGAPVAAETGATDALDPREKEIRTRLRKLPFGTWFEFRDPVNGHVSQRKLAWFSPMSGRALFVTRRGQRAGEVDMDTLAHQVAKGLVREMPAGRDHVFDRAWHNLTGNLNRPRAKRANGER